MKGLIILLSAIIVIGGAVIGLGNVGIINIPGITPIETQRPPAPKSPESGKDTAPSSRNFSETFRRSAPPAFNATPQIPPAKDGTERLAQLWSAMDSAKVAEIIQNWPDGDVLMVLAKMDDRKLAELLSVLPAQKAALFSKGIKELARGGK